MSTRQPDITVGLPRVSVTVVPTGDPQIDAGLEAYLLRQNGIDSVAKRRLGEDQVLYNVGLALQPRVGLAMFDLASSVEAYYVSWGMTPQIRVVNDL